MTEDFQSGLHPELNELTLDQLITRFLGEPPEPDDDYWFYDELVYVMRRFEDRAVEFFVQQFERETRTEPRAALLYILTFPPQLDHPAILPFLYRALNDGAVQVVQNAISGLRIWKIRAALDRVRPFLDHADPFVQARTLEYLSSLFPEMAYPLLLEALNHPHWVMRAEAADRLGELALTDGQKQEVLPLIRRLLDNPEECVREVTEWSVEVLEWEDD